MDTAAASTGAGLAALVAKKTAENFKEMLQQKNTAIESQRIKTQTKLSRLIEENKTAGSPGVAAAAMLASVVVTVMYFAAQIAVTIFFVLLILLIPIIVIVSFLGIIITLLSGFAAAVDNTDYASGSGASIVAVAVQEIGYHEGAGNHTKYGVYTGTDGMSWCHAFVSWCANECGFIESNIIPKTAACETGRQWFIHKQQYQKAGSYTPQAGDIIYFDKGGVGESHHVGIVEYVENGIVHTIEGNKNNQVMRGHYELTYKGIMGYGTPDYPDEGLTSSTASEILSKAQEIGKMMVEEKWVYSNTDLKGSLAAAEQSAKRTNCAHGVCLVLQEVGLLKKGQIFFGNKSGELSCNGTVRKQIEKGFDIIKTGGKKSKDLDLKPGDICLFKGHTNIYAGKMKVKNTDPLNGNEEQEQGNENVSIDPAHYLSKKEKKNGKGCLIPQSSVISGRQNSRLKQQKNGTGLQKTEPSSVQEKEKQAAKIFSKERKYRSNTWKEPVDKKEIGSHGGNGEIASKSRNSRAAIRSQSTVAGGEKAADIASPSVSTETAKAAGNAATKTADTAAASTGAGLAALVAKKTAENFKEMLQQKNTAIESQRIKTQTKLSQLIEENKTGAGSPGVAAAAMLASVVVTVMYFAVQIAVTIFFVLLLLLIPIIVIVSFLGIIITLLSGFAAAVDNTDYASGSGASIVAVAVQEIGYHEGAGNHTKYGVYTGTDGMSWCHAFVSWCANECGFIESNIIPKTAACETGRQWFIHKQQYQKAGSYTPQAGDIIYFDKGGVGESHHVGIVEYVENGIVHTIEGNKNNQVMRGHYELTYKGIMGYGTPDYPDEGLTSSTASEILSKAQEFGKMMVDEKWVYSNYDLKGSLAAAEQSAKRTNCAHGVCLVLQEIGLLKKDRYSSK